MSRTKKTLSVILIVFIAIQFIQPARNKSGNMLPADVSRVFIVPENVQSILKRSCYDCHSNHTDYPWYSYIQPIGWWLASHVKKGKAELNFSEFGNYSSRKQQSKLFAISKSIEDGTMPFSSYTFIHQDSKLTKNEKALIINWANKTKDNLAIKN